LEKKYNGSISLLSQIAMPTLDTVASIETSPLRM
jgi:hypothetical protein